MLGLAFGGILTRLADIQVAMGVGQAALGVALVGTAVGLMGSATLLSPYLESLGFRRVMLTAVPGVGFLAAIASLSPSPWIMFLLLVAYGFLTAGINTIINVEADRTEALDGRRIMNRCHAIYSFGFLSAALIGGAARQAGIVPWLHLLGIAVLLTAVVMATWGKFAPAPPRPIAVDATAPRFAIPTIAILLLGAFTLAGMIYEGGAADWGVIYMRDAFDSAPFVASLSLAFGSITQAASRFFSDRYVERFGPIAVARFMLTILFVGALCVTFSPLWTLALLGFALMGAGNAVIMPLALSAAARRSDRAAEINVAALNQLSWVAFFAGPPVLGFAAQYLGTRFTFGVALPLIVLSFLLAPVVLTDRRARFADASA